MSLNEEALITKIIMDALLLRLAVEDIDKLKGESLFSNKVSTSRINIVVKVRVRSLTSLIIIRVRMLIITIIGIKLELKENVIIVLKQII